MKGLKALTLSHQDSPIDIREMVAIEPDDASSFLLKLKEVFDIDEALLISTCNRTEIYYTSGEEISLDIIGLLASFKGIASNKITDYFKTLNSKDAVQHLFRVALGLESKVLGDLQISNQVKRAYQQSADLNLAGPFLHRLMHTIFYANKRVVQETRFQDGTASVASVSAGLVENFVSKISNPRVTLVGLGEIGQNVLENINSEHLTINLVNRSKAKAESLAVSSNIVARDLAELPQVIEESDVVISAATANEHLIRKDQIIGSSIHKLFIDLGVPRTIDPELDSVPGVSLFNIDQLSEKTVKAKKIREKAVPEVEEIIEEAILSFTSWQSEMEVSPTIQKLKNTLDQIRQEELARYSKASDEEMKLLETATKNMIQKVIKLPVLQLKAACKRGEAETLVGVLNDLFNLEEKETQKK